MRKFIIYSGGLLLLGSAAYTFNSLSTIDHLKYEIHRLDSEKMVELHMNHGNCATFLESLEANVNKRMGFSAYKEITSCSRFDRDTSEYLKRKDNESGNYIVKIEESENTPVSLSMIHHDNLFAYTQSSLILPCVLDMINSIDNSPEN